MGQGRGESQGDVLCEWADRVGLSLLNRDFIPSCWRTEGEFCVDITWATLGAVRHVSEWRVAAEVKSLFDHRYILMRIGAPSVGSLIHKEYSEKEIV